MSFRYLIERLRVRGVRYCIKKAFQELSSYFGERTANVRAPFWIFIDSILFQFKGGKQNDILYVFYDLWVSPPTYDIIKFLIRAEIARKESGYKFLNVVFVPGPANGFRTGDAKSYPSIEYMQWTLRNLMIPCCWQIPSCRQVMVCATRQEAQALRALLVKNVFPKGYTPRVPILNFAYDWQHIVHASKQGVRIPTTQATTQAINFVKNWIQTNVAAGKKVITVSLREASWENARNSDLKEWVIFARNLDSSTYCPVFLRDTEVAFNHLPDELNGFLVFSEASWNIEIRAAVYELSYLNLFVASGPSTFCRLNRHARSLTFKSLFAPYAHYHIRHRWGIEPGTQMQCLTPFHRLVWEEDKIKILQSEFKDMCDYIEQNITESKNPCINKAMENSKPYQQKHR